MVSSIYFNPIIPYGIPILSYSQLNLFLLLTGIKHGYKAIVANGQAKIFLGSRLLWVELFGFAGILL